MLWRVMGGIGWFPKVTAIDRSFAIEPNLAAVLTAKLVRIMLKSVMSRTSYDSIPE